jgi:hypothetical protein
MLLRLDDDAGRTHHRNPKPPAGPELARIIIALANFWCLLLVLISLTDTIPIRQI